MKSLRSLITVGSACVWVLGSAPHCKAASHTESQNLNDNQVPVGWILFHDYGPSGGLANGRLQVNPVDSAVSLFRPLTFTNRIASIKTQWRGWMEPTFYGLVNAGNIWLSSGTNVHVETHISQTLFGNNCSTDIEAGSQLVDIRPPVETGVFRYMVLLEQGRLTVEIRRDSDGSLYSSAQTNSSAFSPNLATNLSFTTACTTDHGTWIDDLSFQVQFENPSTALVKAVKPSFSNLFVGTNYQLQVSSSLNAWTNQGSVFTATNASMVYPQYWDVDNWGQLFFRLQESP